jgi:hypothetical protein
MNSTGSAITEPFWRAEADANEVGSENKGISGVVKVESMGLVELCELMQLGESWLLWETEEGTALMKVAQMMNAKEKVSAIIAGHVCKEWDVERREEPAEEKRGREY